MRRFIDSPLVRCLSYENDILTIEFQDKSVERYRGFSRSDFLDLIDMPEPYTYYEEHIRDNYPLISRKKPRNV